MRDLPSLTLLSACCLVPTDRRLPSREVKPNGQAVLRVEDVDRGRGYLEHFESFGKGLAFVGHVDFVIVGYDNLTARSRLVHITQNLERDIRGGSRRDRGRRGAN